MTTKFLQKGDTITYTNGSGSAISSNDIVVVGNIIGIAITDIPDGESGELATSGVFTAPKVSAAVFSQGEKLIYDVSVGAFDDSSATPATGDVTGAAVAWASGADGDTTAKVLLTPGNTDVA